MFADKQFFASVTRTPSPIGACARLRVADDPRRLRNDCERSPRSHRLPMAPGHPDTVFADEENGVVAIKHGGDILYVLALLAVAIRH